MPPKKRKVRRKIHTEHSLANKLTRDVRQIKRELENKKPKTRRRKKKIVVKSRAQLVQDLIKKTIPTRNKLRRQIMKL